MIPFRNKSETESATYMKRLWKEKKQPDSARDAKETLKFPQFK